MRFLAIFDGLFFAWQWWEIALFKGKNRFAVGGVSAMQEIPSFGMLQGFGGRVRHGLSRDSVSGFTKGLTRPVEPLPRASPTRLAGGPRGVPPCLL